MLKDFFNNLKSSNSKYPKGFIAIIDNLDDESQNEENIELIWKAYSFAKESHKGQKRNSGEPYFIHCENVALILSQWKIDIETIIAGLLHDIIEDTSVSKENLIDYFNKDIANLVEGVTKLSGIGFNSKKQEQAENFIKMFLSMARDIRVILIKFADRLHNMSTIDYLSSEKQKRIAMETKEVYVPLAHRLGMNNVKMNMEDLILQTLEPKKYKNVKRKINNTKREREKYIERFISPIKEELNTFKIDTAIFG